MKPLPLGALALLAGSITALCQNPETVQFTVDASKPGKPISRYIYGANLSLEAPYTNLTLTRAGGNRWTAYNWTNNASNAGSDWHYQNDALLGRDDTPGGALAPAIKSAGDHGAGIVLTVPMAGYVSADKKGDGDVRKSGADYLQTRFRKSLPRKGAPFTLTPSPTSEVVYQDEFVNWVLARYPYGVKDAARPIFFDLDNEPDLWASTHAEIHPANPTYDEMVQRTIDYSRAIKDVAPAALIFGPVNYGWQGYVRLQNAPDANNRDFQEFYLRQMAAAEKQYGKRLLDVLDVHWYPEAQGGGKRIVGEDTNPDVVAARVQAPRSLWDAAYKEKSWITNAINAPINLLPRLQHKIDQFYPGTKLAFTEYNYGGGSHISGAIAEADVLGIFGRDGVFAACQWPMAGKQPYVAAAFAMYRN
ncbi:MAG TPA: glycoside hydrolase family 44 protein, partial [Chthoniobacteraceae bacterium]|nr:glycoside hydrolase family 44 protein [Chthoniobacteraceae bacterium]